ncbi:uncharacterized protein LOC116002070 isoform X1 [Ipomoea triloba]|uniref:uncharacterized protein LOC116002070 isoform X1 n=1 Tax=Ipomoea triloba TaxID=35885 RepID=UPI00125E07E1|nr:uncharacterized protein LOC116002070 isoform X1 [Ipomoea triloba]
MLTPKSMRISTTVLSPAVLSPSSPPSLCSCFSSPSSVCFALLPARFTRCDISGLYLHTVTETRLIVDNSIGEKLHINVEKPLQKHGGRLEHNETYCGTCFGAEMSDDDCCNSCEEVREAHIKRGI